MKLKADFITQTVDDTQFLVGVGAQAFNGIVRSNKTAAFIVDCLKQETMPEQMVEAMYAKYDAPRETLAADVQQILDTLRSIDALEE